MLKSLAVLALFVAVMQVAPAVQRQTANDHAQEANSGHPDPERNKRPSTAALLAGYAPQIISNAKPANDNASAENQGDSRAVTIINTVQTKSDKDWWDKAPIFINGILAIVAIIGAWYAYRTLKAIEGQLTEIKSAGKQTDEIIKYAGNQAKIAAYALDLSRETTVKQLRAYVLVASAQISFGENGIPRAQVNINIRRAPRVPKLVLPPAPDNLPMGTQVLGPGNETIFFGDNPSAITRPDDPPNAAIYVYGEITYKDAFGNDRSTKYRLFLETAGRIMKAKDANGNSVKFSMQPDSDGNEAT
jgi:hypothetical protein